MYIGSASLGFSLLTETMYIKHSVSLIGTGGLVWLSVLENVNKTETMYIKHSVSLIGTGGLRVLSL
jgi:hypothetical protein